MKALVLDFDGVLFDSARESFAVALRTYRELEPDSTLGGPDTRLRDRFVELMPLGDGALDYGTVLSMLERGLAPRDQDEYDGLRSLRDAAWLERYRRRFYEVRHEWAARSPREWRELMPPYEGLVKLLRRRRRDAIYAIATAKDRASVDVLLAEHGLDELFAPELILDNASGPDKSAHLGALGGRLALPAAELTFVDDKVNHLDSVAPLGVRCALAAWGYNGPREHRLARERGYAVCGLDDAESILFGTGALSSRP